MHRPLFAPNGSPILRPSDFTPTGFFNEPRARQFMLSADDFLPSNKEQAADYAPPTVGSAPAGLGFNFGDTYRRTQRGTMEFNLPLGQMATINESLRFAAENVFVGKAMRMKTDFTCKGIRNASSDDVINSFFDRLERKLRLWKTYRQAVWLYYTVGLVPVLLNEPDSPITFTQILDPRHVTLMEWYGKRYMYLKPDKRMLEAIKDPKGTQSQFNKDYYDSLPKAWKAQIQEQLKRNMGTLESLQIKLTDGSYTVIQNRATAIDRQTNDWDGAPLQPYFSACQQYRQLMSGDFAAGFLAKNLLALVSIGDPKTEGDNYIRPDDTVNAMLQATLQNPNQAQWLYGDPTFNVRYITPDVDTFSSAKYDEVRGHLQELLPNCFWSGEDGSFANSSTSLMSLQDEVDACNDAFDEDFFRVIYERAAERDPRIAKKATNPPMHDRNALRDKFQWFQSMSNLYANGGLDVRTLVEEHGYDYEDIKQRLKDQQADVKKGYFMPAFEPKQGIVTGVLEKVGVIESSANEPTVPKTPLGQLSDGSTLHISPPPAGAKKPAASATAPKKRTRTRKKADGGKGGRPTKVGATRPQPETNSTRAPRPNTGGK